VRPDYRRLEAAGHNAAPGQAGAPRQGPGGLNNPPPPSAPTLGREPALKRCSLQVGSVNANGSFEQHNPPHGALIMFASTGTWRDLAGVWMCGAAVLVLRMLR
jgi:hypothetical protein